MRHPPPVQPHQAYHSHESVIVQKYRTLLSSSSNASSSSSQSHSVLTAYACFSSSDSDELSDESDDEFRDQEYLAQTSHKTFKLFMTHPNIARSFLRVFVPDPEIKIGDQMSEQLNFAASLYAHQLREGDKYKDIKKVLCINILGDGSEVHMWPEKRHFQHFRFQDQHGTVLEKGIEIIQYPLGQDETLGEALEELPESGKIEFKEWWEFLAHKDTHKKEMVAQVQTDEVREAYELVRFSNLSPKRRASIIRRKQFWDLYKDQTKVLLEKGVKDGIEEGKKGTARRLITMGLSDEQILHATELPLEEIRALREVPSQVLSDAV